MLFSSVEFLLFFLCYFLLRKWLGQRLQLPLLIIGSTVFYAFWNPLLAWVPAILILSTYGCSLLIQSDCSSPSRLARLWMSIAALLIPLIYFKYWPFFVQSIYVPLTGQVVDVTVHQLPLGISFITFTMIAYLVDVYRQEFPLIRNLATLGGFTMFFPQLIAGPILRPRELVPQLTDLKRSVKNGYVLGCGYFTIGLLKKCLFADMLSPVSDAFFAAPAAATGWEAVLGTLAFTIQIYCDFSGYTDMAIGSALILGIKLPENFDRPYLASSVAQFWRQWHITLSNWIRDYIYIPLGGSRAGELRQSANIFLAMTICGLWHGANWTFVVWGALHGCGIIVVHLWRSYCPRIEFPKAVNIACTFVFVALGWVLFRADSLVSAMDVYRTFLHGGYAHGIGLLHQHTISVGLIAAFFALHPLDARHTIERAVLSMNRYVLYGIATSVVILTLALNTGSSNSFIYFEF